MTKMTIKTTKKKNVVDGGNNGRVEPRPLHQTVGFRIMRAVAQRESN
jgi:hypothetical protein